MQKTISSPARRTEEYLRARDYLRSQLTPSQVETLRRLQSPDVSIDDLLAASRFVRATIAGRGIRPAPGDPGETDSIWICLLEHALAES